MAETNGNTTTHNEEKKPLQKDSQPQNIDALDGRKRRRPLRCCCLSCLGVMVVIIVTVVILALTVFKAKDPKITLTSVSIEGVKANLDAMKVHLNLTLFAGMAVKNPNKIASFKHGNSTTIIIYRGLTIGEAVLPPGKIKADKTVNKNVTVTVYVDEFVDGGTGLLTDGISGSLNVTTRTKIAGRVKLIGIIKKHISVHVECLVTVDVGKQTAEIGRCDKSFKL